MYYDMRPTRRTLPALLLVLAVVSAMTAAAGTGEAAASASGITSTTENLAPGLTLTRIVDPDGPTHIYVITIDPSKTASQPLALNTVLAGSTIGSYATTSQIASGNGALAGINGDFTVDDHPLHSFAVGSGLRQLGLSGIALGLSSDLSDAYIQNQRPTASFQNLVTKAKLAISDVNSGRPSGGNVVAYTTYGNGGGFTPPTDACSVRLKAAGRTHWASASHVGVYRDWHVDRVACQQGAMPAPANTMVLSARRQGKGARLISALKRSGQVRVSWSLGLAGVNETLGGMPELVTNGADTAPPLNCGSYFCSKNPRTGVGITADGKILLVVVDGRQAKWSPGLTLYQFGKEMMSLGARYAVNLDGGGGSAMWVKGEGIINRPSDRCEYRPYPSCLSGERPVTNALLVMNGAGNSIPLPFQKRASSIGAFAALPGPTVRLASPFAARAAMAASLTDPGSTGGLMDALVHGQLGGSAGLPPSFVHLAMVFRAAQT
jgi:Phosphodiester glycosidase